MDEENQYSVYFSVLSIIQPASIDEIEEGVSLFLKEDRAQALVDDGWIRNVHEYAQRNGYVIELGEEKYSISYKSRKILKDELSKKFVDNRRLFLLKYQRKEYKGDKRGSHKRWLKTHRR